MAIVDKIMAAIGTGKPLDMARASYAYSRMHGLTRREAFVGAWELFWEYRAKARPNTEVKPSPEGASA